MHSIHEDVARRAYELFLSRGAQHGCDIEDWLKAERQVVSEPGPAAAPTRRRASSTRASKPTARRRSS
jgi:hypothetical protein